MPAALIFLQYLYFVWHKMLSRFLFCTQVPAADRARGRAQTRKGGVLRVRNRSFTKVVWDRMIRIDTFYVIRLGPIGFQIVQIYLIFSLFLTEPPVGLL